MRKYFCDTYERENNRESVKVIWKCVKKALEVSLVQWKGINGDQEGHWRKLLKRISLWSLRIWFIIELNCIVWSM